MAIKKTFSIVQQAGSSTLYKMEDTDFRMAEAAVIGKITKVVGSIIVENGYKATIVQIENGDSYRVFYDWSASKIEA